MPQKVKKCHQSQKMPLPLFCLTLTMKERKRKIIMRAVGQRNMGIQEVMHQILSIKLVSSTFQVISSSLDGFRKVSLSANDTLDTEKSLLDLFAKRKCLRLIILEFLNVILYNSLQITSRPN